MRTHMIPASLQRQWKATTPRGVPSGGQVQHSCFYISCSLAYAPRRQRQDCLFRGRGCEVPVKLDQMVGGMVAAELGVSSADSIPRRARG